MDQVGPHLQEGGVTADSFEALADLMVAAVGGRRRLIVVCGPITSGGTGDERMNFDVFNAAIEGVKAGYPHLDLFDQRPFEYGLRDLAHRWYAKGNMGYCTPILEVCYTHLFETGAFSAGFFIPGYWTSKGAAWEREKLSSLECVIVDLAHADIRRYLQQVREEGTHIPRYPQEYIDAVMMRLPQHKPA